MSSVTTDESPGLRDTVCAVMCSDLSRAAIHRKVVSACYKCILLNKQCPFAIILQSIYICAGKRHRKICRKNSHMSSAVYKNPTQNSEKMMDLRFSAGQILNTIPCILLRLCMDNMK
jgi:hypothetical protein